MCVHEIIAKVGFGKICYKEIYSRRKRVTESPIGWTRPANDVDAVLGSLPEVIDEEDDCILSLSDNDHLYVLRGDCAVGTADGINDAGEEEYDDDNTIDPVKVTNLQV